MSIHMCLHILHASLFQATFPSQGHTGHCGVITTRSPRAPELLEDMARDRYRQPLLQVLMVNPDARRGQLIQSKTWCPCVLVLLYRPPLKF